MVDYFIALFVDYHSRRFLMNGFSSSMHLVSVKSREKKVIRLEIDSIEKGGHDFMLLAMNKKGFFGSAYPLLYHRANIFVGDCVFRKGVASDRQEIEIHVPGNEGLPDVWKIIAENPYVIIEQHPGKITQVPARVKISEVNKGASDVSKVPRHTDVP